MWHVETDIFALLLFVVLIIKNRRFLGDDTIRNRSFMVLLVVGLATTVIDFIASLAMNGIGNWWFFQITMTLYAMTQTVPTIAWISYIVAVIYGEDRTRVKRWVTGLLAPLAVVMAIALTNPFTSLFFNLTADMEYTRGPLFIPLGFGLYGIYSLFGMVLIIINRKRINPRSDILLMGGFFVGSFAGIMTQLANPGWLLLQSAYALLAALTDATMEERARKELYRRIQEQNVSLEEAIDRAEEASKARERFFSSVSHDMRTPMNGILGLASLALDEDDPATIKGDVKKIQQSGEYLLGLINDTLDMQRLDSGSFKLEPVPTNAFALLENIADMIGAAAKKKGITFDVQYDPDLSRELTLDVDPLRLKQIFANLLNNAVKFTPSGGTVTFLIECLSFDDKVHHFRFKVSDTGVGMSEEFISDGLYRPFSQERNDMTGLYAGSGLGLSIVKNLVDLMGGRIKVRSELGKGTTFTVFLDLMETEPSTRDTAEKAAMHASDATGPLDAAAAAGNGADGADADGADTDATDTDGADTDGADVCRMEAEPSQGRRVLLCEDNELNAEIAVRLLDKRGITTDVATDGGRGLDRFSDSPVGYYAAILMDVRMPVMDGLQATRAIRALARDDAKSIPIIAMTADAFDGDIKETLQAGMNAHLSKPIDPELLYQTLEGYISQ